MNFDINFLRSLTMIAGLIAFIGIVIWAWSAKNADRFEEAARLPFEQD
jgi:cytochrome c oxidase cbb3-type subunit 4